MKRIKLFEAFINEAMDIKSDIKSLIGTMKSNGLIKSGDIEKKFYEGTRKEFSDVILGEVAVMIRFLNWMKQKEQNKRNK